MTDNEKQFYDLCKKHDLTYAFSDDHRWWSAGVESLEKIRVFAEQHLTRHEAVEIWNRVCDEKLIADAAKSFYWVE